MVLSRPRAEAAAFLKGVVLAPVVFSLGSVVNGFSFLFFIGKDSARCLSSSRSSFFLTFSVFVLLLVLTPMEYGGIGSGCLAMIV